LATARDPLRDPVRTRAIAHGLRSSRGEGLLLIGDLDPFRTALSYCGPCRRDHRDRCHGYARLGRLGGRARHLTSSHGDGTCRRRWQGRQVLRGRDNRARARAGVGIGSGHIFLYCGALRRTHRCCGRGCFSRRVRRTRGACEGSNVQLRGHAGIEGGGRLRRVARRTAAGCDGCGGHQTQAKVKGTGSGFAHVGHSTKG
jgi:hypothetical protein